MHDETVDACVSRYQFAVVRVWGRAEGAHCGVGEVGEGWGGREGEVDECVAVCWGGGGRGELVLD